ncbi:hypothetical protein GOP47_0019804 [Adiantum capillus-veneris]|uniref:Uncharacterized protein n=1 Tax=Adiantum capillus-veneris TaxID=13818 RepID=A0A9D4Z839_ADICA|nr:hypothetical protein GOP47_0019804 [Adiantum capillus-veneris]
MSKAPAEDETCSNGLHRHGKLTNEDEEEKKNSSQRNHDLGRPCSWKKMGAMLSLMRIVSCSFWCMI